MHLIYLAISWLTGIVAADVVRLPTPALVGATLAGALLAAAARRSAALRLAGLCLLCAAAGGLRYELARVPTKPHSVWQLVGQGKVTLEGAILSDPKRTEEGQQVILTTGTAYLGGAARRVEGLVLLNLPPYPQYRYGQRLRVTDELKRPRTAERPGEFDYRAYLARRQIFALMREPDVRLLPGTVGNPLLAALADFRNHCQHILMRSLPEPHAALAVGILLGLQASVPATVYDDFSITGTSHILVVSGWNFTIVAALIAGLSTRLRLGRGATFWSSLVIMWIYALLVGAGAAVLRAAAMASLVVLAQASERRSEPWTVLLAACWLLSIQDPNTLWDLGFQLSALATASLFAFGKPTERLLHRLPPLRWPALAWATEALTATFAAQILALPIILYHFGNLSLIAPLANLLLVPVVPYAMLLGTVALAGGLLWPPLGQWAALGAWLPLSWLSEGTRLLARAPYAAVIIPPFPLWVLLSYYGLIAGAFLVVKRRG